MSSSEGVKIVIINTEYIQTDANNFKSVVQKFTGNNSSTPAPEKATQVAVRRRSDHDNKLLKDLSPLDEFLGLHKDDR